MIALGRRDFLMAVGAAGLAGAGLTATAGGADAPSGLARKFTMCLSCGTIGVRADQRQAIALAHRFGFEAVEPSADFAAMSDGQLEELLGELKANQLVWGAGGLSVEFRQDEATFRDGMKGLARTAKGLQRAGVTRVATWLMPNHKSLAYVTNFRQHARRLREAAKVLKDHGQRLGLEYVGPKTLWADTQFPFIHTMAEMKELIAEIAESNRRLPPGLLALVQRPRDPGRPAHADQSRRCVGAHERRPQGGSYR